MRRNARSSHRFSPRVVLTGIFFLVIAAGIFFVFKIFFVQSGPMRKTVVLIGDPVIVISLDETSHMLALVSIPADAGIEAVHEYGTYSLEAIWKLGILEHREGDILMQSLEEAVAVPIQWYAGPRAPELFKQQVDLSTIKKKFALSQVGTFFSGQFRTNISLGTFVSLSRALNRVPPENVVVFDSAAKGTLVDSTLADGSTRHVFDTARFDALVGTLFEDETVRREALSVSILNTTDLPLLGTRVARVLGHAGGKIVSVGNDSPQVDGCQMIGTKSALTSKTAAFIKQVYACSQGEDTSGDHRADLTIRIGKSYASRFIPFPQKQ